MSFRMGFFSDVKQYVCSRFVRGTYLELISGSRSTTMSRRFRFRIHRRALQDTRRRYLIFVALRDFARQGSIRPSVETRRRKSRGQSNLWPVDIDRDVIYQCVGWDSPPLRCLLRKILRLRCRNAEFSPLSFPQQLASISNGLVENQTPGPPSNFSGNLREICELQHLILYKYICVLWIAKLGSELGEFFLRIPSGFVIDVVAETVVVSKLPRSSHSTIFQQMWY